MEQRTRFSVAYHDHSLIGDVAPAGQTPTVLMLHGAGSSRRQRYYPLQDRLAAHGVSSAVFDMVGHGETGGALADSSLKDRTNQATAVIEALAMTQPLSLLGSSMGAYNVIKLTQHYQIDKLALLVPGVYAADAYEIPFDVGFTERLRKSESWRESDAWDIMEKFQGDVFIITAENDEVVPREIPQKLYDAAIQARSRTHYQIPGAPHLIKAYLNQPEHADLLNGYLDQIEQFFISSR